MEKIFNKIHRLHSTQLAVQIIQYTVHWTQYTEHSTQHKVLSPQYAVQSTKYTLHSSTKIEPIIQYTIHNA